MLNQLGIGHTALWVSELPLAVGEAVALSKRNEGYKRFVADGFKQRQGASQVNGGAITGAREVIGTLAHESRV